jgi:hypothetical protein
MLNPEKPMKIELQRGRLLRLRRAGSRLTVHAGSVWITEHGNLRDIILRPGESFVLAQPGIALLEACSDAALSYEPEAAI